MALELNSLEDPGATRPRTGRPIGAIVIGEDHSWSARRDDGTSYDGEGAFRRLDTGFWVNNLPFDESRQTFVGTLARTVRADGWWRMGGADMLAEWGAGALPVAGRANLLSLVYGRMSRILMGMMEARGADSADSDWNALCRSGSLATGLSALFNSDSGRGLPLESEMIEHFDKARQTGIYVRSGELPEENILMEFRFPRHAYAAKLLDARVPASSIWKRARRPDNQTAARFLQEVMASGRPALMRAFVSPDDERDRDWIAAFASTGGGERSRFLPEELVALEGVDMEIESALVGEAWEQPVMAQAFESIVAAAGGPHAAALSWSAGLLLENVLIAPHRAGRRKGEHATGESLWLSAMDRIHTLPLVRVLDEHGARILSARSGRVQASIPPVPEIVTAMMWAAWDAGAHVDLGTAIRIREETGIDLPVERSSFGGGDADFIHAAACHSRDRKSLWKLDGLHAMEPGERDRLLAETLGIV